MCNLTSITGIVHNSEKKRRFFQVFRVLAEVGLLFLRYVDRSQGERAQRGVNHMWACESYGYESQVIHAYL